MSKKVNQTAQETQAYILYSTESNMFSLKTLESFLKGTTRDILSIHRMKDSQTLPPSTSATEGHKYIYNIRVEVGSRQALYLLLLTDYSSLDWQLRLSYHLRIEDSPSPFLSGSLLDEACLKKTEPIIFSEQYAGPLLKIIGDRPNILNQKLLRRVANTFKTGNIVIRSKNRFKIQKILEAEYRRLGFIGQREMWNKALALEGKLRLLLCFKDYKSTCRCLNVLRSQTKFKIYESEVCPVSIHVLEFSKELDGLLQTVESDKDNKIYQQQQQQWWQKEEDNQIMNYGRRTPKITSRKKKSTNNNTNSAKRSIKNKFRIKKSDLIRNLFHNKTYNRIQTRVEMVCRVDTDIDELSNRKVDCFQFSRVDF